MTNSNQVKTLAIKDLFYATDKYLIPPYQRNYAWREPEIRQLIQDIIDQSKFRNNNYYIGTLVTYLRDGNKYEVIDGQQRLTTLSLLMMVLQEKNTLSNYTQEEGIRNADKLKPIIEFASRKKSTDTLISLSMNSKLNTGCSLESGYNICQSVISSALKDDSTSLDEFINFLLNKVHIIRVVVPPDTDLNHYFEIMNNRGEQLEKHEVLKARLMNNLLEYDRKSFATIWDACANMDKYVQYGFSTEERGKIFGTKWDLFICADFDEIKNSLITTQNNRANKENSGSIESILNLKRLTKSVAEKESNAPDRFNPVVNFPNFLLHVLRVFLKLNSTNDNIDIKVIPLDDKRLLESFNDVFTPSKDPNEDFKLQSRIKDFAYHLLRCKFLFDKYVIKREVKDGGVDGWELKSLISYSNNIGYVNTFTNNIKSELDSSEQRKIILLLSMFHVSAPAMLYKYWLNGALYYLSYNYTNDNGICPNKYIEYLQSLARKFVFGRYLRQGNKADYDDMIYDLENSKNYSDNELKYEMPFYGNIQNNLVFNYLDYLLCYISPDEITNVSNKQLSVIQKNFAFTFRSSVEHYYPQTPMEGYPEINNVDSFGNLCLISHEQNSRLSNYSPEAKKNHYKQKHMDNKTDSIKQYLMMSYNEWGEQQINEHGEKMEEILKKSLNLS